MIYDFRFVGYILLRFGVDSIWNDKYHDIVSLLQIHLPKMEKKKSFHTLAKDAAFAGQPFGERNLPTYHVRAMS